MGRRAAEDRDQRERQRRALRNAQRMVRYWKDPEPERERFRAWRRANPEKGRVYRQGRREEQSVLARQWKEANREKHRLQKRKQRARRRARERGGSVGIHWTALYLRDGGLCGICGQPVECSSAEASVDHLVPLSEGGADVWENVRLAHQVCNTRRRLRMTDDLHLLLSSDPAGPAPGGES